MPGSAQLKGVSIIGSRDGQPGEDPFRAVDPSDAAELEPDFFSASLAELDQAVRLADNAFPVYSRVPGRDRGNFLQRIAEKIESATGEIVQRAHKETALPEARLRTETVRTCSQLRLFADVVEEGSWVNARIDRSEPQRQPLPKPDIRSMLRPLGTVAVFGASNFPLAFSVAGGDSASALAAGNPVIVKAHPAHPGTSEIVGLAIRESAQEAGMPDGVFSLLFDSGTKIGSALVQHPLVKAVGFTGSRQAGLSLMKLASSRRDPIPFFGEMSSTNPVFILPGALRERSSTIAAGLYNSFTMGAGQFCTKPGMVFLEEGLAGDLFAESLQEQVSKANQFSLLTPGIQKAYKAGIGQRRLGPSVKVLTEAPVRVEAGCSAAAVLFETDAQTFSGNTNLASEIFGPSTLLVRNSSRQELLEIADNLDGHLTATVHGTPEDLADFADLLAILERKVGRIVVNGFPTGVEVSHAMVHGGPFPATTDGQSTSVGSRAMFRFARPLCYQGFPDGNLPEELRDSNPLGIWRMIDGQFSRGPV
jgi:2,5-dioxopentanoate dehydrogenase